MGRWSWVAVIAALVLAVGVLAPARAQAQAPPLVYATLTVPGQDVAVCTAVNDSGGTTGYSYNSATRNVSLFELNRGVRRYVHMPGYVAGPGSSHTTTGISTDGTVVGTWHNGADGPSMGYQSSVALPFEVTGAAQGPYGGTMLNGISPSGTVIFGDYADDGVGYVGFISNEYGTMLRSYAVPGAVATSITFYDGGVFGGYYLTRSGASYGFVVRHSRRTVVTYPGLAHPGKDEGTVLVGMTSAGVLVGQAMPNATTVSSFVDRGGAFATVHDPLQVGSGAQGFTIVNGVSPNGRLCGDFSITKVNASGEAAIAGFVASPPGLVQPLPGPVPPFPGQ